MSGEHDSEIHVRCLPDSLVLVTYGRGSVLLRRCRDMLCTSGFVDDVILGHKRRRGGHAFLNPPDSILQTAYRLVQECQRVDRRKVLSTQLDKGGRSV